MLNKKLEMLILGPPKGKDKQMAMMKPGKPHGFLKGGAKGGNMAGCGKKGGCK